LAIEALSDGRLRRLLTDIGALKAMIEELGELDQQTAAQPEFGFDQPLA
jgi:hypothetical protein